MSGDRFLLDTNAVIALPRGNTPVESLVSSASWLGVSVITVLEYRVFKNLSDDDARLFKCFIERIEVINLDATDSSLVEKTVELRRQFQLKLPDAIIAATAYCRNAAIITSDKTFKRKIGQPVIVF